LNFGNQVVSAYRNKRKKGHVKPIDLNSTQSSALRPQSSNLSPDNFEQVCTELLREGHMVKFSAPGISMYPTICDGDLITVEPIKSADICVWDIILYHHSSGVVAHRVIRIVKKGDFTSRLPGSSSQSDLTQSSSLSPQPIETQSSALSPQHCFTLRGDAAIKYDDPVCAGQILGKVVSIERNGRRINPYSFRVNLCYKTRRLASRIKRLLISPNSSSA